MRNEGKCPPRGQGTVLDIGANNGVISIGMLATGEMQQAIAVEPDPGNFQLLQRNVEINGLESRIRCLNYAAAEEPSELEFELCESNYGDHRVRREHNHDNSLERYDESHRNVIKVQAETIDHLMKGLASSPWEDVSLVWIDVQGYEGYAFRGASGLLGRDIPVMAEVWPYGIQRAGMSIEEFGEIAGQIWSTFWIQENRAFVDFPIERFTTYLTGIGVDGDFENVIFMK